MENLAGKKYGRWTVTDFSHKEVINPRCYRYYWNCECECGTRKTVLANSLRSGTSTSCGCYNREIISKAHKHGMSKSRLYSIWHLMIQRCENANNRNYHHYGGRGIKVCKQWHDSAKFIEWALNNGYSDELSIDRIDVNGNYEPLNCRWVDKFVQANNTRRNRLVTINGETHTVAEWCRINKISYKLAYARIEKLGYSYEDAVQPLKVSNTGHMYIYKRETKRKGTVYDVKLKGKQKTFYSLDEAIDYSKVLSE